MPLESKFATALSDDEGIPSMLDVASKAMKKLRRLEKHASTCEHCKEIYNAE